LILAAEKLSRRFGDFVAVREVSLGIQRGETVALVGRSGSGKTTLLHMLGLLEAPSGGRVVCGDIDASALSSRNRAALRLQQFGFVFQVHHLLGHLTARENVALPHWRQHGDRTAALEAADQLLDKFGVDGGKRPAQLSTGGGQRVAIARALVNKPSILLADEPTGSLDSASAKVVLEALFGAHAEALVIVTHDLGVAERAQRRITLSDGSIVAPEPRPQIAEG
jgi:ABC-type lipoprotein export system ATPase subunit